LFPRPHPHPRHCCVCPDRCSLVNEMRWPDSNSSWKLMAR
jgi:hypothetical protein